MKKLFIWFFSALSVISFLIAPTYAGEGGVCSTTVTTTADDGNGSLREAINCANNIPGAATIIFNIPGAGLKVITVSTPLPPITDALVIDGYSQPGSSPNTLVTGTNAILPIELRAGVGASPPNDFGGALRINASDCAIRGLVINGFAVGIEINGTAATVLAQRNRIEGCFIGTNATGNAVSPTPNEVGIRLAGDGFTAGSGATNNLIGGTTLLARNLISGNRSFGITMADTATQNNRVEGNLIGTNAAGTIALGNNRSGIFVTGARNNTIGGLVAGTRNVIAGHPENGVVISGTGSDGNVIRGNFIGTNAAGTAALGNGTGLSLSGDGVTNGTGVRNNIIGGTAVAARNVISGNGRGIALSDSATTGNVIQGNFIGTNATGTARIANTADGVLINGARNNTIGGAIAGARNVISGNGFSGIQVSGDATNNIIRGNFIGIAANGTTPLGNTADGILLSVFINDATIIGGPNPGQGNRIAQNGGHGINLTERAQAAIQGNVITGNALAGVHGQENVRSAILGNSIFNNVGLGIDLEPQGATPNDAGDADTGPNNLQNFPVLTAATLSTGTTTIQGMLNSTATTQFRLDFFSSTAADPSGFGEGQTFLGAQDVTTNAAGLATFSVTLPLTPTGNFITATATPFTDIGVDLVGRPRVVVGNLDFGGTSEFSRTIAVATAQPSISVNDATVTEGNTGTTNATFTVTLSAASNAPVTVNFSTRDNEASAPGDFTAQNRAVTIPPGQTTATVIVPVIGDRTEESNELFTVALTNPQGATLGRAEGNGRINNDDTASATIDNVSVMEGNAGTTNAVFTVTLSNPSAFAITVNFSTANGTAIAPTDYTATNGTLTFAPGQTSRTINVPVVGDTLIEADETFTVNIALAGNGGGLTRDTRAVIGDASGTATIINDDQAVVQRADLRVTQTVSASQVAVGQNATFTITVTNGGPAIARNVVLTNTLPTGATVISATPAPATNANGVLTFNLGDLAVGASRTFRITVRLTQAGTVTNRAIATSPTSDPAQANNTSGANVSTGPVNVTGQITVTRGALVIVGPYLPGLFGTGSRFRQTVTLRNNGAALTGPLSLVLDNLSNAKLLNASGTTRNTTPVGSSFINVNIGADNLLATGESVTVALEFSTNKPTYTPRVLAGAGTR